MSKSTPKLIATRLYIIVENVPATEDERGSEKPVALVDTTNPAVALRQFVRPRYVARLASQRDIIAATKAGIEAEAAAVDPE